MKLLPAMRNWLVEDFGWKIFSLVLAVGIWLTVHRLVLEAGTPASRAEGSPVTYDNLPVSIVAANADVRDFRLVRPTVKVTVSGSPEVMGDLKANQIHATIDLSDGRGSSPNLRRRVEVSTPPGVALVSVVPQEIGIIEPPKH
jgi:hypothetical protein